MIRDNACRSNLRYIYTGIKKRVRGYDITCCVDSEGLVKVTGSHVDLRGTSGIIYRKRCTITNSNSFK